MARSQAQLPLFAPDAARGPMDTTGTFADNLTLPLHRWFRYTAGFSALWVRALLAEQAAEGRRRVLDPFGGSGTVLLEAEVSGYEGRGLDAHPFVARVARAKLLWRTTPGRFAEHAAGVLERAARISSDLSGYGSLIYRCYPPDALDGLDRLRRSWAEGDDGSAVSELTWLALMSILRQCSPVGTAQWQYVLPNRAKVARLDPLQAFRDRVAMFVGDMEWRQSLPAGPSACLERDDARVCRSVPDGWADLVVTSPPYANNYDYADATRLEMTFMGDVDNWGGLHEAARRYLVRSCTQHVAKQVKDTEAIIDAPLLAPIRDELRETCARMEAEREQHGGRKPYHTMIAGYFSDMAETWHALRRATSDGALACFVIGDSAPYGIYVPVERWLGELALGAGFRSWRFEVLRDRNIKWKNRKHRVPLKEGRLWVEG